VKPAARLNPQVRRNRRRANGDAQHFDREGRHQGTVNARDERNAPDDAAIGVDRYEAVPGSRTIQLVDAGQHTRIPDESRRDGHCRLPACIADDERRRA
jgi:hypothetical protein